MTVKRLIAIIFIFMCTFFSWMILGAVNLKRTSDSSSELKQEVRSLYGDALTIKTPTLQHELMVPRIEEVDGKQRTVYEKKITEIELKSQHVDIDLDLDRRKKGTLWFPTYKASFKAEYVFTIPDEFQGKTLQLYSSLGNSNAIYRDVRIAIDDRVQKDISPLLKNASVEIASAPKELKLSISYRTTGMEEMRYLVTPEYDSVSQIRLLQLTVHTDFNDYDFVAETLSPTSKVKTDKGYDLKWNLKNAVTGKDIGVVIPNRLNPGEILSRVTFFAPIPLLFFFFIVMVIAILKRIPLHPMHYFFLATSFFSFHLIFSYYSDHMNIYMAFAIASVVSLILTASYLRLFTPKTFAFGIAPVAQLIYLVIFSFTFFFKGISGMIGATFAVLTLAVMMQLTGKLNWEEVFGAKTKPESKLES
ncbi:MAG: inner membrane CreD family protein [Deltaproteobacteria bacterium]|nr:inner membrane CreD family protein [Deltaproteobacteria bacterium]